jgi:hypothetical protein
MSTMPRPFLDEQIRSAAGVKATMMTGPGERVASHSMLLRLARKQELVPEQGASSPPFAFLELLEIYMHGGRSIRVWLLCDWG